MPHTRRHKPRPRSRNRYPGLYKLLSAALILAAVVAACAVFFRVGEIDIQGNSRYTRQEILEVAGVELGDNLFTVDRGRMVRELQSKLPYIQTVNVRLLLPDTLSIAVTEGDAVASVSYGGEWWYFTSNCKLLERADSPGGHPVVTGLSPLAPAVGTYFATAEEQRSRLDNLKDLLDALERNELLDKLDSIDLSEEYVMSFSYDGRLTVNVSSTLEMGTAYWLHRFAAALENPRVAPNQRYTVEILDGKRVRFIPD